MSLLTSDDVTVSGQARIRLLLGSGLSNTTWFSAFGADLRGIRPLLARSRLFSGQKPASVLPWFPGSGDGGAGSVPSVDGSGSHKAIRKLQRYSVREYTGIREYGNTRNTREYTEIRPYGPY